MTETPQNASRRPAGGGFKSAQWWFLITVALLIVFAWPPDGDKSLAVKAVNWAVDPRGELPTRPPPLAIEYSDDPDVLTEHAIQLQDYDSLYAQGGWARKRLELKVASDPFNPATERQLLTGIAVAVAFLAWRAGATRRQAD